MIEALCIVSYLVCLNQPCVSNMPDGFIFQYDTNNSNVIYGGEVLEHHGDTDVYTSNEGNIYIIPDELSGGITAIDVSTGIKSVVKYCTIIK